MVERGGGTEQGQRSHGHQPPATSLRTEKWGPMSQLSQSAGMWTKDLRTPGQKTMEPRL